MAHLELVLIDSLSVFGLERCILKLPKDENGMYRINPAERCTNYFLFAMNLAYNRLSHQGDPCLIERGPDERMQVDVARMSRKRVTAILQVARCYGIRGVYEEMKRLICNDMYLQLCHYNRTARRIQQFFAPRTPLAMVDRKTPRGFLQFLAGLSPGENEIYVLSMKIELSRQKKILAATLPRAPEKAHCEEIVI